MNLQVKDLLQKNGLNLELKNYKEMEARDGYHMKGTLYINGKKGILFEDLGNGGGCEYEVINEEISKPLIELVPQMKEINSFTKEKIQQYE